MNICTTRDSKEKSDFKNLYLAYDSKQQNAELTRVRPTSATCLDHISTSFKNTETFETTFSDQNTILGTTCGVEIKEPKKTGMKGTHRDLRKTKGENTVNFVLLDQILENVEPL